MAKKDPITGIFYPGIIYDLGYLDPNTNTRTPFYVGETSNPKQRLIEHQRAGKNADNDSTRVYQTIKAFDEQGIKWSMETIVEYGSEGPTDLEDEWIVNHIKNGYELRNMKKGNANWLEERQTAAREMTKRGINSYRKYREVITQEELNAKHAKWLREEEEKKQLLISKTKAELARKQILEDTAKKQAEVMRQKALEQERAEKERALRQAKWEADLPAREARIKAQNEQLQAERDRRQKEDDEYREQERLRQQKETDSFIERYNKNYSQWPNPIDRARYQRDEDAQVRLRRSSYWTEEEIVRELEIDRRMSWPPGRTV